MLVFLNLPDLSLMNEDYFEKKYYLMWESSVLNRKGTIPMRIEPIDRRTYRVEFEPWTEKTGLSTKYKVFQSSLKVKRFDTSGTDTLKIHCRPLNSNSQCVVKSRTTIKMKEDMEETTTPVEVMTFTSETFELVLELEKEGYSNCFYKSPHLIN